MTFLRYLWLACSGFRTYRELLGLSLRSVVIYWGILSSLLAAVLVGDCVHRFKLGIPVIQRAMPYMPSFSLTNGQAYSSLPQPCFSNTNDFPIILDLEMKVDEPEKKFPKGILIRKREFRWWLDESGQLKMPWTGWPDGEVNAAYLENLEKRSVWLIPYLFLLIWLILSAFGLIQSFFFTTLAGLLERSITPSFTFSQLFNIALFAMTPGAIIVTTYFSISLDEIPYSLLYISCYCTFFVMASGACRSSLKPQKRDNPNEGS